MPIKPQTHLQRMKAEGYRIQQKDSRASAYRRGYGRRWQRLRLMVLREEPICRVAGCNEPSTQVDHIIPLSRGGTDARENLQGMCTTHHSQKTATEDGGFGR